MKFKTELEVRYSETDAMGVVYHANYFGWFDVARINLLKEAGHPYELCESKGYFSPVVKAEINYGIPFRFGETAVIYTHISKLTPVKVTYSYEVYSSEDDPESTKPRITGSTIHCLVDKETFKPKSSKKCLPELHALYSSILEED